MRKLVFSTLVVVCAVVFAGCSGTGSQGSGLLSSSGRSGEVLVVCSDKQWKGALGDSVHTILMQDVIGLPQAEPSFTLSHVSEDYLRESYKKQRNIVNFTIDQTLDAAKIVINHNAWAQPQLLITIKSKDEQQAIEALSEHRETIINYLLTSEFKRFQRAQKSRQNFKTSAEVAEIFNLASIVLPEGFIFALKKRDFVWLRQDTKDWTQNIMIYTEDYTDTNQFRNDYIIRLRDTYTKKYVSGTVDNSYVGVEQKYIPTMSEYIDFEQGYAIRTVGLWEMVGDYMGGPFVNMTVLDVKNNRIITIDGFLYAPSEDNKRDLLRQIEAIMRSVKISE